MPEDQAAEVSAEADLGVTQNTQLDATQPVADAYSLLLLILLSSSVFYGLRSFIG